MLFFRPFIHSARLSARWLAIVVRNKRGPSRRVLFCYLAQRKPLVSLRYLRPQIAFFTKNVTLINCRGCGRWPCGQFSILWSRKKAMIAATKHRDFAIEIEVSPVSLPRIWILYRNINQVSAPGSWAEFFLSRCSCSIQSESSASECNAAARCLFIKLL